MLVSRAYLYGFGFLYQSELSFAVTSANNAAENLFIRLNHDRRALALFSDDFIGIFIFNLAYWDMG